MTISLESLLTAVRADLVVKDKRNIKLKLAASERRHEVGDLEWNAPIHHFPDLWLPFAIKHIYERQICEECLGETRAFHQELVAFQHRHRPTDVRWVKNRGEALDSELPIRVETIDFHIPRCWDCQTVDRLLRTLWSKSTVERKLS